MISTDIIKENQQIHVESLHDSDIDALVDRFVFHHSIYCSGKLSEFEDRYGLSMQRCEICGSIEEPGFVESFGCGVHARRIPGYTASWDLAWQIVDAMRERGLAKRFAEEANKALSYNYEIIFDTQGVIAVAALKALGVLDAQGFVVGSKERRR